MIPTYWKKKLRSSISYLLLLCSLLSPLQAHGQQQGFFPDVPVTHWAINDILWMINHPIGKTFMAGNPDGTFAPERPLNRAEMAKIAVRYHQLLLSDQAPATVAPFQDVVGDTWYYDYVQEAASYGILTGFMNPDGSPTHRYGPNQELTIAQAIKILAEVTHIDDRESVPFMYEDVHPLEWYFPYVQRTLGNQILAQHRNIRREETTMLQPNRPITRAELAVLLRRFMERTLEEEHSSALQGFTQRHNSNAYRYRNLPRQVSLRFPTWFGHVEHQASNDTYRLSGIPNSLLIFTTIDALAQSGTPQSQIDILQAIARKEINPQLIENVQENLVLFHLPDSTPIHTAGLQFSNKDGIEQLIHIGSTPTLQDYYIQSLLVRDQVVVFQRLPLFPTAVSNLTSLEGIFAERTTNHTYYTQFHFGLLQRAAGNKEALDFLQQGDVKSLTDRIHQYRAFAQSATLHL